MFFESGLLSVFQALPSPDEVGISLSTRIARLKAVKTASSSQEERRSQMFESCSKEIEKGQKRLEFVI